MISELDRMSDEKPLEVKVDPIKFLIKNRLKIVILAAAVLSVYLNTLNNGFVSDDRDLPLDYQNQSYFKKIFSPQVSYRTPEIFHYLDSLGGLQPWRYHLTNILLHATATILIFFLLSQLLPKRWAFFSSLLFAVHPIHTDAVSWVVARSYILFTIFILTALLFYLRATQEKGVRKRDLVLSLAFYLFAFDARWAEPVMFPWLLLTFNYSFRNLREKWQTILPYLFVSLAYPIYLFKIIILRVAETSSGTGGHLEFNNPLTHLPIALFTYLKLFLFPIDLTFYHEDLSTPPLIFVLAWLTLSGVLFALIYFALKNKKLFFFLALFLLSLAHTFSPLKITWAIAERYVYFGSIGLSVLFTAVFLYLTKNRSLKTPLLAVLSTILVLYSARTIIRNFDWKNEDTLWLATIKTSPTSSKALNNIGDYYGRAGDPQKSFDAFIKATQINPTYADAWHNAGNVLLQNGKFEESIPYFEKSIEFNPNLVEGYDNLAVAYAKKGELEKARDLIKKSLKINPQAIKTYLVLAQIEYESGNIIKAEEAILQGLQIDPNNQTLKEILNFLQRPK